MVLRVEREVLVVATNCNGVKEVLAFDDVPDRGAAASGSREDEGSGR